MAWLAGDHELIRVRRGDTDLRVEVAALALRATWPSASASSSSSTSRPPGDSVTRPPSATAVCTMPHGTGGFTSRDTWQLSPATSGRANRYAYGEGQPLNGTDPTGH